MKIVFTSCMDASRLPSQPVWNHIKGMSPDVLMLLGDQIYMDWFDLGASNWRRAIDLDSGGQLADYAQAMHSRYQQQAAVPEFLDLLQDLAAKGKQVIVTWDDHDFAWNDSVGVDPGASCPEAAGRIWQKHGVQSAVKKLSLKLLVQFRQFTANPDAPYPSLADAEALPDYEDASDPQPGVPSQLQGPGGPIDLMVLDTRFHRTPRPMPNSTILGAAQGAKLFDVASQAKGLLILAAGSPMKHRYMLGEQDWTGGPGDEYPEFAQLLEAAKRPVLYLSGDIHRNSWGGRVKRSAGQDTEVIQLLGSAASIDHMGPKHFPPSFGYLEIASSGTSGSVQCKLLQRDESGEYVLSPGEPTGGRKLDYKANGWVEEHLDGEASDDATWLWFDDMRDTEPLAVLTCIPREHEAVGVDPLVAPMDDLGLIDAQFKAKLNPGGGGGGGMPAINLPERLWARVVPSDCTLTLSESGDQDALGLMNRAFANARAAGRSSVVLFVHGTGKSPVASIDQGYGLRALYNVEPIVFSWPAGRAEGGMSSLFAPAIAKQTMGAVVLQFREVMKQFAECAHLHPDLTSVLLARSAGAVMLHETLAGGATNEKLTPLTRIVLSSPSIEAADFERPHGNAFTFDTSPIPETVVTVNRMDQTLARAKWVSKPGDALGKCVTADAKKIDHVTYLDFQGVGVLHDYLFTRLSDSQMAVNAAMLTQKEFNPAGMEGVTPGQGQAEVYLVNP